MSQLFLETIQKRLINRVVSGALELGCLIHVVIGSSRVLEQASNIVLVQSAMSYSNKDTLIFVLAGEVIGHIYFLDSIRGYEMVYKHNVHNNKMHFMLEDIYMELTKNSDLRVSVVKKLEHAENATATVAGVWRLPQSTTCHLVINDVQWMKK